MKAVGALQALQPYSLLCTGLSRSIGTNQSCPKCHSEERSDEESVGGAGSAHIVPTTPRPFAYAQGDMDAVLLGQSRTNQARGEINKQPLFLLPVVYRSHPIYGSQ